jgi:hypothetical protein
VLVQRVVEVFGDRVQLWRESHLGLPWSVRLWGWKCWEYLDSGPMCADKRRDTNGISPPRTRERGTSLPERSAAARFNCEAPPIAPHSSAVGSYTSFSVDGYQLLSSKSYVDPVVMTMFTEAEKADREVGQAISDDGTFAHSSTEEHSFSEVGYATTGSIILDRLQVMGFTLRATRAVFEAGITREILETRDSSQFMKALKKSTTREFVCFNCSLLIPGWQRFDLSKGKA